MNRAGSVPMIVLVWAFVCSVMAPARAQTCASAIPSADIASRLDQAEQAYRELNARGFTMAMDEVVLLLPCVDAIAAPSLAAQLHRLQALRLHAAGQTSRAVHALRAARVLDPDYRFPEDILPAGSELLDTYQVLPTTDANTTRIPHPADATAAFDGRPSLDRPQDRTTLFQLESDAGTIIESHYLEAGAALPRYPVVPRLRNRLLVITTASAVSAGTLATLGWRSRTAFYADDLSLDRAELEGLQTTTNRLFAGSLVLGITATSSGVAAGLVGKR